jgi:tetratricopeptide (TPR) repeat protein
MKAERYFGSGADADDYGLLRRHQSRAALLRGETQEAIDLAGQALGFVKEHRLSQGSAWYALGSAQAAAGDLDAAAESFGRAAELLERGGEWREATAVYREWAPADVRELLHRWHGVIAIHLGRHCCQLPCGGSRKCSAADWSSRRERNAPRPPAGFRRRVH